MTGIQNAYKKMALLGMDAIENNSWCIVFKRGNYYGMYNFILDYLVEPEFKEYVLMDHFFVGKESIHLNNRRDKLYVKNKEIDLLHRYKRQVSLRAIYDKDTEIVFYHNMQSQLCFINYAGKMRKLNTFVSQAILRKAGNGNYVLCSTFLDGSNRRSGTLELGYSDAIVIYDRNLNILVDNSGVN